jgi:hypothetical protein
VDAVDDKAEADEEPDNEDDTEPNSFINLELIVFSWLDLVLICMSLLLLLPPFLTAPLNRLGLIGKRFKANRGSLKSFFFHF